MEKLTQADIDEIRALLQETPSNIVAVAAKNAVYPNMDYALYSHLHVHGEEQETPLLVAEVFEQVAKNIFLNAEPTARLIALLLNNAEALLEAAGYYLQEKEIFEEICGNEYETSLGLMVYGVKAKKFFKEMENRQPWTMTKYEEPVDVPANCEKCQVSTICEKLSIKDAGILCAIITSTAKAAGLLEGE